MPSSRARTRASRETCFSALSWRSAPTKSRLMGCLLLSLLDGGRVADTKRRGLVTHVQRRPCVVRGSIHPGPWTPRSRPSVSGPFGGVGRRRSGGRADLHARPVAAVDVVL